MSKIEQLRAWLTTTNQFFESINLKKDQRRLSYMDYLQFKHELESQEQLYNHLKLMQEENSLAGEFTHSWKDIDTNWQKVITQVQPEHDFTLKLIYISKLITSKLLSYSSCVIFSGYWTQLCLENWESLGSGLIKVKPF